MINSITQNALRALLYEVTTEPKPGLVDPASPGPHPDMNIYTFIDSSLSLTRYLTDAVELGRNFKETDLTQMFYMLRQKGLAAEKAMFTATQGVNTHKGAIFALGIFTCAESYCQTRQTELFTTIQKMCRGLIKHDLVRNSLPQTAGEKEYAKYGYGGARAEAEQGYPIVEKIALPFLKNSTGTVQTRLLDTLMKIATVTVDSNLIKRAGKAQVIDWLHQEAAEYLALGGYATPAGQQKLTELAQDCLEHNYSLGGCADLLIVTIFVGLERNYL
ncbi:triphosphoribosyl-dephospho-CoA synthase CitG [Lactobacillus sp. ESL0703]|uniref:triphosphoribosyl-dephospho-CoA synthase CitG n=1 Tax=Lactobacillus sp. ESL0703 TaxID=2983218 RepID=UPI0023F66EA4|nr:triphosphoribosyl-dephospho-CoA synthase CitG [Lactobacillus sp. ESL0703]MDF7669273.1 triphosphoribosyl-dephospho-CoA synthase CitG [Lactobacillus sp. ESL0703]